MKDATGANAEMSTAAGMLNNVDFYTWTQRQADLLKSGHIAEADVPNLIEELETLGRAEIDSLRSSYRLIAMHLLKMRVRTSSWRATIVRERNNVEDSLRDNPGLRPKRADILDQAYAGARREAAGETGLALALFPAACPFAVDDIEGHDFWP